MRELTDLDGGEDITKASFVNTDLGRNAKESLTFGSLTTAGKYCHIGSRTKYSFV